jgi:hypothetical protein
MPLTILPLPSLFRPGTSHVYPPFKKGRYMEEFIYDYLIAHQHSIRTTLVYLPIYWTNLQNHPNFTSSAAKYDLLLQRALQTMPKDTRYVTVVQHDDGPRLTLPKNTIIMGACTGTVPLPLLYEDTTHYLAQQTRPSLTSRSLLASFVGTNTHPVRAAMVQNLTQQDITCHVNATWSPAVPQDDAKRFIDTTLASRFCLAPRGYGRSSFRFFEAIQLDTIPVYVWDDIKWLPYQEVLDYDAFSISVHVSELPTLHKRLKAISEKEYECMVERLTDVKCWFTLEGMCEYIVTYLQTHSYPETE